MNDNTETPSVDQHNPVENTNEGSDKTLQQIWGISERAVRTPLPPKKKRWGLFNVFMGFVLLFVFQVIGIVLITFFIGIKSIEEGTTDADAITESALALASNPAVIIVSAFGMYLAWMIAMSWATFKKGLKSFSKDFWLRFKWTDILWGLLFGVALRALDIGISWFLQDVMGVDMSGAGNSAPIVSQTGIYYVIIAIVIGCICAPFFEELFIRGLFLQALLRFFRKNNQVPTTSLGKAMKDSVPQVWYAHKKFKHVLFKLKYPLAVIISSFVFGLLHFQGNLNWTDWYVVGYTGLVGCVLAIITLKFKRLGTSIGTHIVFNATGIVLATIVGM